MKTTNISRSLTFFRMTYRTSLRSARPSYPEKSHLKTNFKMEFPPLGRYQMVTYYPTLPNGSVSLRDSDNHILNPIIRKAPHSQIEIRRLLRCLCLFCFSFSFCSMSELYYIVMICQEKSYLNYN